MDEARDPKIDSDRSPEQGPGCQEDDWEEGKVASDPRDDEDSEEGVEAGSREARVCSGNLFKLLSRPVLKAYSIQV